MKTTLTNLFFPIILVVLTMQAFGQNVTGDALQSQGNLTKDQFFKLNPRSAKSITSTSLPLKMSYQGLLTTAGGTPVADGSYDLTVTFYDSLAGGSSRWTEAHSGTAVQRGTFSVTLGVASPLTLQFNQPLFVEVSATNGPAGPSYPLVFSPRSQLTSSPYALAPWVTNGTDLYYKNGNIGIGSSAPESSKIGTLKLDIADEDGLNSDIAMRVAGGPGGNGGGYPIFNFAKSKGSLASPTMLSAGNYIGQLNFLGFDGTYYQGSSTIVGYVDSVPSPGAIPGGLSFYTYNATRGWSEKMRLDRNGSLNIDDAFMNDGALRPGLAFGGGGSGEGIASKRTGGGNQYGLDFYTSYTNRMSITGSGLVGIGTTTPGYPLHVRTTLGAAAWFDDESTSGSGVGIFAYAWGSAGSTHYGVYGYGVNATTDFGIYGYASGGTSNYGVYGYASGGTYYAGYFSGNLAYTGSFINASDAKFKENVADYSGALSRIMQVRPRTYTFKSGSDFDRYSFSAGVHYGFVAQELEQVFPELVVTAIQPPETDQKGNPKGDPVNYKGIKSMEMIPILLQAIQEQQKLIEDLQAKVSKLENR